MLEDVLDLGREVESHAGKFGAHRAHDAQRVAGAIQKIGVAERDVGRAGPDLPPDIFQDNLRRHDDEAAFVHRHDGTVEAVMQASAAGFNVADDTLATVVFEMCVPLQRRESIPAWNDKRETIQMRPNNRSPMADSFDIFERVAPLQSFDEVHEWRLVFPADYGICHM